MIAAAPRLPEAPLDSCEKGVPGNAGVVRLEDVTGKGWNILREDLPMPVAVLKQRALSHNSAWMAAFLGLTGAQLAPHGKTSMAPGLFDLQLADGAWAITLSAY